MFERIRHWVGSLGRSAQPTTYRRDYAHTGSEGDLSYRRYQERFPGLRYQERFPGEEWYERVDFGDDPDVESPPLDPTLAALELLSKCARYEPPTGSFVYWLTPPSKDDGSEEARVAEGDFGDDGPWVTVIRPGGENWLFLDEDAWHLRFAGMFAGRG